LPKNNPNEIEINPKNKDKKIIIADSLYFLSIDKLNKSFINDENVLRLPENPIRNEISTSAEVCKLVVLLNDNEIPKINEATKLIDSNLLLLFIFIELNLVKIKNLIFAPTNDPNEIIKK
tara:strand:+ start:97 stop:456 length:360 start_codon:yes stop_codon:yes gene_type:complete